MTWSLAKLCAACKVPDKATGRLVPFALWDEQRSIAKALQSGQNVVTLKARQVGSSTIHGAYLLGRAMLAEGAETVAVVAHKWTPAADQLRRIRALYLSMPQAVRDAAPLEVDRADELAFKGAGRILAVSASGHGGLRSFTASVAWITEIAFAENADELLSTVLGALNGGQLLVESTANYPGDALQRLWETDGPVKLFFPWWQHHAYRMPVPPGWQRTPDEDALAERFGLDDEQLAWRRERIALLGSEARFAREYPATPEEAWATTTGRLFPSEVLAHVEVLPYDLGPAREGEARFAEPEAGRLYVLGVDPAGGTGGHRSSIRVLDAARRRVVYAYDSPEAQPPDVAAVVHREAVRYGAVVMVEADAYGMVILDRLRNHYGYHRVYLPGGRPARPTAQSQAAHLGNLRADAPMLGAIDRVAYRELLSVLDEGGRYTLPETRDGHCDAAMALALANAVARLQPVAGTNHRRPALDVVRLRQRRKALVEMFR